MSWIIFIPLVMQALFMMVDEFYFHRRRGLPKWEIIGHPLDTLTVIAPLLFIYYYSFSEERIAVYAGLSLFSCLFIVKDELVHINICSKGEMILHALLFIFHPLVFLSMFLFWQNGEGKLFGLSIEFQKIVSLQLTITCGFCIYQIFYWRVHGTNSKQRNIQRARR